MARIREHPRLSIRIEKETKINLAKIKKKLDVDWNRLMEILVEEFNK